MSERKFEFTDFEWGETIGEGSYGVVVSAKLKDGKAEEIFKLRNNKPQRYAIKKLSKQFIQRENMIQKRRGGRDVLGQVMNERNLLQKLDSPLIVRLFGTFQTKDELFYVLSYQSQSDMRVLLNAKAALEGKAVKFYMAEIFSALFYLHDNLVIHRDMKPENVLLGDNGNGIHLKLCDFATAKDVSKLSGDDRARTFVGSAEYISPELLGGNKELGKYACYESDIWAAGCITYFMLAGLPPFCGDGEYETFRKVEAIEYTFPVDFHESGKSLIESILVSNPDERLGAKRAHAQIRSHRFFEKINWENLETQTPPEINSFIKVVDEAAFDLDTFQSILNADEVESAVDDYQGAGILLDMPKDRYQTLLKDQKLNRNNIANRWNSFVDGELILRLGYIDQIRGLFPEKRMFLLTGGQRESQPKLVLVDARPNIWEKVAEITFNQETKIKPMSVSRFQIHHQNKCYDLMDKHSFPGETGGTLQWVTKLDRLCRFYFSES